MTRVLPKRKAPRKGCPYLVTVTCDLTPPHNFIRETRHKTYKTALKIATRYKKELSREEVPGLKIEIRKEGKRRTAWEHILSV
jgi:hypothetical protein